MMSHFTRFRGLAVAKWVVMITCIASVVAEAQDAIPRVPTGHPRVYVRAEDLPGVRQKIAMAEFQDAWERIRKSDQPVCQAFVYLVTGNETFGQRAVTGGLKKLKAGHEGRPFYNHMHKAACIYDWCYALLSETDKAAYIDAFKTFAARDHKRGYPPNPATTRSVTGHDCEGFVMTNLIPAGVAIYDEDPDMYLMAARIFFDQHVPACNYYYQAHMHHQGTHYCGERFVHDIATSWLFKRLGAGEVFSPEQQFVTYQLLYHLLPDGQFLKMGDDNDGPGISAHKRLPARLAATYYDDPYLLTFSECKPFSTGQGDFYAIFDLLFLEPDAPRGQLLDLPLTKYFGYPMGTMLARTGWEMGAESRAAIVQMHIGQLYFSNHHHRDFGTFQMYYRGLLAMDTGVYQAGDDSMYGTDHWRNYYQQTAAHNGLMVFDPATLADDHGGQHTLTGETRTLQDLLDDNRRLGEVTGWAFGPDSKTPRYSYLAGDITQAYAGKVQKMTRSMVTLNTGHSTYPCIFVVYDHVVSSDAAFKKAWYLHALQEPEVKHGRTTIVCDREAYHGGRYGGKLVVDTLLPLNARIEKVGGPGKEFWSEATQTNYAIDLSGSRARGEQPGAWRVEVSPSKQATDDRFLHVLTAMDVGTSAPKTDKIENTTLIGVLVDKHAVLFNRTHDKLVNTSFDLPGQGTCPILVCGLAPGAWRVVGPNGKTQVQEITNTGSCLYFEGEPGNYHLALVQGQNRP